jgi:selenide,water dikinase
MTNPVEISEIRLTQYARGGGCAAKLRLADLVSVLDHLRPSAPASGREGAIVVSNDFADDAAVVRLEGDGDRALVLTTDVIAPLVDDPEAFGAIAATNAISDVYAMGGKPLFALNLMFFPNERLPIAVLDAILAGSARACARMGVAVVGGHTVCNDTVFFGIAVTGTVDVSEVLSNRGAHAGQALVLSKALGTGVIGTAIKAGVASADETAAAIASMTTSNGGALAIARRFGVTACTDVTGYGLLGHLRNVLRGSELSAHIDLHALPLLPGVLAHARAGRLPGGSKANLAFITPSLKLTPAPTPVPTPAPTQASDALGEDDALLLQLAADAQTSGGLLLCVPAEQAAPLVAALRADGLAAATVGRLEAPDGGAQTITLTPGRA